MVTSASIELVSSLARVTSIKFTKTAVTELVSDKGSQ